MTGKLLFSADKGECVQYKPWRRLSPLVMLRIWSGAHRSHHYWIGLGDVNAVHQCPFCLLNGEILPTAFEKVSCSHRREF